LSCVSTPVVDHHCCFNLPHPQHVCAGTGTSSMAVPYMNGSPAGGDMLSYNLSTTETYATSQSSLLLDGSGWHEQQVFYATERDYCQKKHTYGTQQMQQLRYGSTLVRIPKVGGIPARCMSAIPPCQLFLQGTFLQPVQAGDRVVTNSLQTLRFFGQSYSYGAEAAIGSQRCGTCGIGHPLATCLITCCSVCATP
jgi:hypothetical protein